MGSVAVQSILRVLDHILNRTQQLLHLEIVFESPVFCGFLAIFGTIEAGAIKKKLCHESRCLKHLLSWHNFFLIAPASTVPKIAKKPQKTGLSNTICPCHRIENLDLAS